jgi:hypothetical protein
MTSAALLRRDHAIAGRQGFNLIEAAIVLGIVGLVVAGVWVAASAAYESLKSQNTAKGLLAISQNLKNMYANIPTTTALDTMANLIAANAIPADWQNGTAAAKSPYGGAFTVGGTVSAATLTIAALTKDQCITLTTRVANSGVGRILRSINAGGTAVTNGGTGTAGFGSVTAASAAGACPSASSNNLVFTFDLTQ